MQLVLRQRSERKERPRQTRRRSLTTTPEPHLVPAAVPGGHHRGLWPGSLPLSLCSSNRILQGKRTTTSNGPPNEQTPVRASILVIHCCIRGGPSPPCLVVLSDSVLLYHPTLCGLTQLSQGGFLTCDLLCVCSQVAAGAGVPV